MKKIELPNVRKDFPILLSQVTNKPLVYLDTAASAQKPLPVVEAISNFYLNDYSNIHRGIYELSSRATRLYENAREAVRKFINAESCDEIIFTRGTTEAINLVAKSFGYTHWQKDDEVILSIQEHHSNIVPWYFLQKEIGIKVKIIPMHDDGALDLVEYKNLFTDKTKLVAVGHVSNALGTIHPLKEMIAIARVKQVPVLVDGAQAISHLPVNIRELDCDFYAFSAHKLYGPTGVGVLYARKTLLDKMSPYQGGGHMIETVDFDYVTFTQGAHRFEAGTPNIAGVIGLSAAINYVESIGIANIFQHEQELLAYAEDKLQSISRVKLLGTAKPKVGVISFVMDNIHPHDIGTVLDHEGVAIRAGHHCAMPLMKRLDVPATVRVSFGIYTCETEINALAEALKLTARLFP